MNDVYTKRNNRKPMIIVGAIIVVIAVVVAVFFLFTGSDKKESILKDYFSLIQEGKYKEAYALTKTDYSEADFITRNQNIYEGIEAKNIELNVEDKDGDTLLYTVKMSTAAGNVEFENQTAFEDEKILWTDSVIFPALKKTDKVRISTDEANRGKILDRNGKMLAGKGEAYSVGLVPGKLNGENDYEQLAKLLDTTKEGIQKTMSASWIKDDSFVPLKTISKNDQELESELLKIPGVMLSTVEVRDYPYGKATSHLIGYMQKVTADDLKKHEGEGYTEQSYIGRSGIEAAYEKDLKGSDGIEIYIIDESGNKSSSIASLPKQDGKDIELTIDVELQKDLYDAYQDEKSASVAMNPKTGEILALVSTPTFSSSDFIFGMSQKQWDALNDDKDQPLYNRFKATWVPGSCMKPITAAIGLQYEALDAQKDFGAALSWQKDSSWGNYKVTTLHAPKPNNLKNALIQSDNVYFAKAALEIGKDNLEKGYKALKIGEDIPFEISLTSSQYTSGDFSDEMQIADSGYGQGQILMNPVQMAAIYSAFVNEGNIMTPHIVKSTEAKVWVENVFSKAVADEIRNDLEAVISDANGTAHSFYNSSVKLAGKTGTGEIKASQDDTKGTEIGWFTVMTTDPNEDTPIVVSTMVEDVKGRGGSNLVVNKLKSPFYQYIQ